MTYLYAWIEDVLLLVLLAGTRQVVRRDLLLSGYWFRVYGYTVWALAWPAGLWDGAGQ